MIERNLLISQLNQNEITLEDVPVEDLTTEICLIGVQRDGRALEFIPSNGRIEMICMTAVQENGTALKFVPEDKRTLEICLEAVKQNAHALKYVPEEFKESIIRKLSVATILSNNYMSRRFFPKNSDFSSEINKFLSSVEQIVFNHNYQDHELRDIQLTYAYKKRNKVVVSITPNRAVKNQLYSLLHDLKQANNTNNLHLAFVSHSNENSDTISELSAKDIATICADHPRIQHIRLLGCNVAKAQQSQQEKMMVKTLSEKFSIRYGLMTALEAPSGDLEFQKKCMLFCEVNNLDGVYVLNKTSNSKYQLFKMQYNNEMKTIQEKIKDISAPGFPGEIINILNNQKKPIKFPNEKCTVYHLRSKSNPMLPRELISLRELTDLSRFEKNHPKYQNDKITYPFLATFEVDVLDLKLSLMKKIADEIQKNEAIKWDITLQGPTKSLHVDTAYKNFKVTKKYLYCNYYQSTFYAGKSNINQKKLKKEMNDMMIGSIQGQEESNAKQIKVTIKKQ